MEPPVLNEQLTANLVPLRATSSESVPAMKLYNVYKANESKKCFANTEWIFDIMEEVKYDKGYDS